MKKRFIFFAGIVLLTTAACQKENTPQDTSISVPVTINTEMTKTYLDYEDGSYKSMWNNGDQLAVFVDGAGEAAVMSNSSASGQKASFTGAVVATSGDHTIQGFYPYAAATATDGTVNVTIPAEQNPGWDTFDAKADFLVAKPVGVTVSGSDPITLSTKFSRLLATVKIELQNLSALPEGDAVQYVAFTNSGNVPVTGTFKLNLNEEENPALGDVVTKNHVAQVNFPETSGSGSVFMNIAPCTFAAGNVLTFTVVTAKGKVFIKNRTLDADLTVKSAQEGKLTTFRITLDTFTEPEYETGLYLNSTDQNWDVSTWGSTTTYNGYDSQILYSATAASNCSLNISAVTYDENSEKGWVSILSGRSRGNSAVHIEANTGMVRKAYLWGTIKKSGKIARVTLIQAPGNALFDYNIPPTNEDSKYGYGISLFEGNVQKFGYSAGTVSKWVNTEKDDSDFLFSKDKYFRKYIWQNVGGNIKDDIVQMTMTQNDWRSIYDGFSVEAIVKSFDGTTTRGVILGGGNDRGSGVSGLNFERLSSSTHWGMYFWTSEGRQKIDFGIDVQNGVEEHLIAVVNPSDHSAKLYKNGVLVASKTYAGTINDSAYPVSSNNYICVPGTAGTYATVKYSGFHGEIYQVRIYDKVLSAAEIAHAYNVEVK